MSKDNLAETLNVLIERIRETPDIIKAKAMADVCLVLARAYNVMACARQE